MSPFPLTVPVLGHCITVQSPCPTGSVYILRLSSAGGTVVQGSIGTHVVQQEIDTHLGSMRSSCLFIQLNLSR